MRYFYVIPVMNFGCVSVAHNTISALKVSDSIIEDTLCHEFAALALSSMAADYSSKTAICENEGMEALIRCLSENDPDVQKNSAEAIGLLVLVSES